MATPARLRAALERLEARRLQLERQIVADLEKKFFTAPSLEIRDVVASHDGNHVTGANIDTTGTASGNGSHITVTWFDND